MGCSTCPKKPRNAASLGHYWPGFRSSCYLAISSDMTYGRGRARMNPSTPAGQVTDIDARCDTERPGQRPADGVTAERRAAVYGDGRDGRGGAHRGGRRACHSHGGGATGGAVV